MGGNNRASKEFSENFVHFRIFILCVDFNYLIPNIDIELMITKCLQLNLEYSNNLV